MFKLPRVLLALAALLPLACTNPAPRFSVLLVVIDTLRGDRIGPAGYPEAGTPVLDALAREGTVFRRAMTPVPVTLPAVASLLTGRYPRGHTVRDNDYFILPEQETSLAEQFRGAGYRTAAVLGSAVLAADRGVDQGFESYDDDFGPPYPVYTPTQGALAEELARTRRRADTVSRLAQEALVSFQGEPFFLLVHYFDVHMYYDPPPEFARLHPRRPYDGEVSFVDHELGNLLAALPDPDNTLVLVVSDHGESQNEHGEPQHGFLLYESTLHVPWLVRGPGVPAGAVREDVVSLIDVAPTLTRMLDLKEPGQPVDGTALNWGLPEEERVLLAETLRPLVSYGWAPLTAARAGSLKVIRGGGREEVYDLSRDPAELSPLSSGVGENLRALLLEWMGDEDYESIRESARGIPDAGRRELLESLGYVGASGSQGRGNRPHPQDALPGWLRTQVGKELKRAAVHHLDREDYGALAPLADSLVALLPEDGEVYYLRAETHRHFGRPGAAAEDYRHAAELGGEKLSYTARARWAEMEHREEDALRHWTAVLRLDSRVWPAVEFMAQRHWERQEYDQALPYLERLAEMNPGAGAVRLRLADCARLCGLEDLSRRHYRRWLDAHPQHPRAPEIRALLSS